MAKATKILIAGTLLALSSTGALAAGGGGGGGGGPSQSAPKYDATAEYQKGVAQLKAEDYKGATRSFKRVVRVAPKSANVQYLLGLSYMMLGEFKKARKPFEKAIKYDDSLIDAHRDLAITYQELGDTDKAAIQLEELKNRMQACGEGCAQSGMLSSAISAVEKAMSGQGQASVSADQYGIGSAAGDTLYLGAVALINEGRYEEALNELSSAGKQFGPHPDVLTYVGFANRKLGNYEQAEDYYKRALTIAPNHLGAIEYYGELKVERGDISGAKRHLARLEQLCSFGCYEAEELSRWIDAASQS